MKCAVIRSYGGLTQNERYIGNNLKHAGKAAEWRPDPQRELADEGSATGGNRGQEQHVSSPRAALATAGIFATRWLRRQIAAARLGKHVADATSLGCASRPVQDRAPVVPQVKMGRSFGAAT
jgi:hypothetical protein